MCTAQVMEQLSHNVNDLVVLVVLVEFFDLGAPDICHAWRKVIFAFALFVSHQDLHNAIAGLLNIVVVDIRVSFANDWINLDAPHQVSSVSLCS